MDKIFFNNWESLVRTAVMAICGYIGLVILLRMAGNRTLSKMNAFDFIVTIALGSTLASILVSKDVVLVQGLLAFALLIGLQYAITASSVHFPWIRKVVTGEPVLLLYRGEFLSQALRKARVSESELLAAAREAGIYSLNDVEAIVLETDGSFSVVKRSAHPAGDSGTLRDVNAPGSENPGESSTG